MSPAFFLCTASRKVQVRVPSSLLEKSPASLISPAHVFCSRRPPMSDPVLARARAEQVPHQHVPGVAYNVADAAVRLIHTLGGGFFNEPKYYDSNRSAAAF